MYSHSSHMFAGYNKCNQKAALVGNWVEEEALRQSTGFSRHQLPQQSHSPDGKRITFHEPTQDRVLPQQTKPLFESATQAANSSMLTSIPQVRRHAPGPRATLTQKSLMDQAKQVEMSRIRQQEEVRVEANTTRLTENQEQFQPVETSNLLDVHRVPRGKNGSKLYDPHLDKTFTRRQVEDRDRHQLQELQSALNYQKDVAVTHYSHAILTGHGLNYSVTAADPGCNPFGRNSAFTNEITDNFKRHGEAMEPGSIQDEPIGLGIQQRSALLRMTKFLAQNQDKTKQLRALLAARTDANAPELIHLQAFRDAFALCRVEPWLTEHDIIQVFMTFDTEHIGLIPLQSFFTQFQLSS